MEFLDNDILKVLLQSVISFFVLFIIAKMLGKKQVSQLTFIDYAIGISMGSIAAEMATDSTRPFYHFIIAMAAFGLLDFLITIISRKTKFFKKTFKGRPLLFIENGKINYEMLKKSKLDVDDLIAQCRSKGYFYIKNVAYCIFERNGSFSVLPISQSQEVTVKDLSLPTSAVNLQKEVIIDGKIIEKELEGINRSKDWLLKQLKVNNQKQLNNIILAVYDEDVKEINAYYKNENSLSVDKKATIKTSGDKNKNINKNKKSNKNSATKSKSAKNKK